MQLLLQTKEALPSLFEDVLVVHADDASIYG